MNDDRMNDIRCVRDDLRRVDQKIEKLMNEEEEYHYNTCEALTGLDEYERSEQVIACLDSALDLVRDAIEALNELE